MKKIFVIDGLCCAHCAANIEKDVNKLDGVINAKVNFLTRKMIVEMNEKDEERITKKAVKICKDVEPDCEVTF